MRYLGIDYGTKKVGVALSDDRGDFAYPLTVLENSKNLIYDILHISKENNVGQIVVGESKDFSQNENDIMLEVKPFVKNLEEVTGLVIHMYPEFMTSQEAERLQGKNDMHDASAAALILKHFLETRK
ncbi:MAG TPA: Holliday junction resolvase RuvX [Candidatus Paceibacterota bacterium]